MVSKKNHAIRGNTKTLLTLTYNATVMVTLGHGLQQKKRSLSSGKISHCQSHHEVFVERLRELNFNMFRYVKKCYVAEKLKDLVRFDSAKIEQKTNNFLSSYL